HFIRHKPRDNRVRPCLNIKVMSRKKRDEYDISPAPAEPIQIVDEARFTGAMDEVVRESEAMRLRYMQRHQNRGFLAMSLGMLLAVGGAAGFGWFFLVQFDLIKGLLCMLPALLIPFIMHSWTEAPVKKYLRDYKRVFMPKMADALGGFKFNPDRGI